MGFYVVPRSVNLAEHACDDARTADFSPELGAADSVERFQPASGDVKFSYSVIWRESDTRWRYRLCLQLELHGFALALHSRPGPADARP